LGLASAITEKFDPLGEWIDGIEEGVLLTRGGVVAWASPRAVHLLGRQANGELPGRRVDELLAEVGNRHRGEERNVGGAAGARLHLRCANRDASEGAHEIWFVDEERDEGSGEESGDARRALHALQRELDEANRELLLLREHESQAAREREELLDVVSHELRTPITVIAGYNRLLLSDEVGELDAEQRRCLEESTKSCKRLDAFIGSLLEASREGSLESKLERVSRSLSPTIESVVASLHPLLESSGQTVHFESADVTEQAVEGADFARFDPIRIGQVVTNLVGNAIKYGRRGGGIRIYTRRFEAAGQAFVEVSVEDEGPGVASWDRTRIFEPYVRSAGEREAGGLGLGLAISKRIVEAHGGSIAVTDAPGGGSRFFFALPAAVHGREQG